MNGYLSKRNSIIKKSNASYMMQYLLIVFIIFVVILIINCIYKVYQVQEDNKSLFIIKNDLSCTKAEQNDINLQHKQFKKNLSLLNKNKQLMLDSIKIIKYETEVIEAKRNKRDILIQNITRTNTEIIIMSDLLQLNNQITDMMSKINKESLKLEIDSKILNKISQVNFIKTMLFSNQRIAFRLLYRKSRDGLSSLIFHEKCDLALYTLSIMKSSKGIIFGGYTEVSWKGHNFQSDQKAFVFNLSLQKKYSIRLPKFAIYTNPHYLLVFGNNDIVITESEMYSRFPSVYGLQAEYLELTGGDGQFTLNEIEVFEIIK